MSLRALGQASTTMNQIQKQLDTVGHNMANTSTPGYKTQQAEFSNLLFQQMNNLTDPADAEGRLTPDGLRMGTGARLGAINPQMDVGSMQTTNRDLDVALRDPTHFFRISAEENGEEIIQFTRDGSFYLADVGNNEVILVTSDGHPVLGEDGPIQFAHDGVTDMSISENGTVIIDRDGEPEQAGSIEVAQIENSRILEAKGENLFQLPNEEESGLNEADIVNLVPTEEETIKSKTLEMSNVDIEDEMTQLLNAQRSYEFNARTLSNADEMQGLINQLR